MNVNQPHPPPEDLFAYRDGELKAERRAVVEAHVLSCHACREAIDEVSRLESELKRRAEDPGEQYLERMTEQVMGKIQTSEAAPRAERRRSEAEAEWEAKRARAPRFPWVALVSTASAAATVLIIAGLLIRQGAVLKNPPRPSVLERSAPDAARSRAMLDSVGARSDVGATGKKRANREIASKDGEVRGDQKVAIRKELAKSEADQARKADGNVNSPTVQDEKLQYKSGASDETVNQLGAAREKSASEAPAQSAPSPTAAGGLFSSPGEVSRFGALLQRYGLPPVWGPGISDENVLRAEPALRNLYRTGGIASPVDSARARLYFAEAMRVKASAAPDSETVEEIVHHYRRAIRLAAGDPETQRIAAQRLQEFLREQAQQP